MLVEVLKFKTAGLEGIRASAQLAFWFQFCEEGLELHVLILEPATPKASSEFSLSLVAPTDDIT